MDTTTISRLAAATPDTRNRVVDLYRAVAIGVVVLGHWLMAAVVVRDGELAMANTLDLVPPLQGLTWVLQVMPLFFLVGGYANATSWRSARAKGDTWATWQRARLRRLMTPVLPLLIAWLAICSVGVAAGVSPDLLRTASQSALVPTWFLAAYVLVVAVAPVTLALWERYGWWSFVGGMAVAAVVDLVSISTGSILVGFLNYLFVWASVHQLGYAWRDGALDGARRRLALSALGLAAVSALVWVGPYPVGMVGTGQPVENSYPARVTLLFLGMFQIGLALLAERRLQAWLQRPAAWRATIAVNARIMTLYLWHMTAMLGLVGLSLALGGRGLHLEPATGAWWATRPAWFAVCGVVSVALIAVFGRLEDPSVDLRPAPRVWRPVVATVAVCGGLAVMAKSGIVSADGVHWVWPVLPVAALLLLRMVPLRSLAPRA
ncbi:acyltransferase family protein [Janibacter hoylei]|uniref:acyltransferase family protein n=1 Tax=Janibacter hoylei TaxID=364298 RepID=UPI0021A4A462|nr:acyltransferase [Janibacter hoylei]MCT1618774.1 acyltransferase [Janibacter hoylei]MCT2293636.1 acyltransferase [Janibacter hoylei]